MPNLFYNIMSIIIGVILIFFSISNLKKSRVLLFAISLLHAGLFLLAGIGGFFMPKEYQYITILAMLALCITMGITLLLVKKDTNTDKDKSDKQRLRKLD